MAKNSVRIGGVNMSVRLAWILPSKNQNFLNCLLCTKIAKFNNSYTK